MTNNTPASYFDRAKAIQGMILAAQEDLRQLREDAIAELIDDSTSKEAAKEIRKDLAEVFAVAKIAAKGDIEERNQAAKMARRKRIAEECGVQLELLPETPAEPARRMARAAAHPSVRKLRDSIAKGEVTITVDNARMQSDGKGGVEMVSVGDPHPHDPPHDPDTGEIEDEKDNGFVRSEPAAMHAGDYDLTDIPDFLKRC